MRVDEVLHRNQIEARIELVEEKILDCAEIDQSEHCQRERTCEQPPVPSAVVHACRYNQEIERKRREQAQRRDNIEQQPDSHQGGNIAQARLALADCNTRQDNSGQRGDTQVEGAQQPPQAQALIAKDVPECAAKSVGD